MPSDMELEQALPGPAGQQAEQIVDQLRGTVTDALALSSTQLPLGNVI
ncbi:MAG TPA: hypothetical protein VFS67_34325 [Polyangiaceae bacterium]|nr:hypothetical protein [Polyangiaceae bacterium]